MTKICKIMSATGKLDRDQIFIASSKTKTMGDQIKLLGAMLETNERVLFMQHRLDLRNHLPKCMASAKSLQEHQERLDNFIQNKTTEGYLILRHYIQVKKSLSYLVDRGQKVSHVLTLFFNLSETFLFGHCSFESPLQDKQKPAPKAEVSSLSNTGRNK